jgi:hypothetical protein
MVKQIKSKPYGKAVYYFCRYENLDEKIVYDCLKLSEELYFDAVMLEIHPKAFGDYGTDVEKRELPLDFYESRFI